MFTFYYIKKSTVLCFNVIMAFALIYEVPTFLYVSDRIPECGIFEFCR